MEIVVNKCYGGFGLSPQATAMLAGLKGKQCYFYHSKYLPSKEFEYILLGTIDQLKPEDLTDYTLCCFDTNKLEIPGFKPISSSKSKTSLKVSIDKYEKERNAYINEHFIEYNRIDRDDPDLIKVVKTLKKKSFGRHAKLEIVEIPDGVEYTIEEYDGIESIHEVHRSW